MARGNADGSVLIITDFDTSGFDAGISDIDKSVSRLKSTVRKLGNVLVGAFAFKKIFDLGKASIELGSDLEEVQNVVDVTFTNMSEKVNEFAKDAKSMFGLSETMAKQYVGTFGAMAKSFGFTESEAYDMSTTLAGLTGDVASFYNISQDLANIKLKSVFTGETETLKDLGVVMTQNALDQFALAKGIGKTTDKMTEQEKVALRFAFVQEKLSAASGDFARTSDSWANQIKVLKLNMESFMATVGQGLINIFTPVIKVINLLMSKLMTLASAFKAFTEMFAGNNSSIANGYEQAAESAEDLTKATDGVSESVEGSGKAAEGALASFDKLNVQKDDSSSGGSSSGSSIDFGTLGNMGEIDTTGLDSSVEKVMGIFEKLRTFLFENKNAILAILGGLAAGIATYFAVSNWSKIVKTITDLFGSFGKAIIAAFSGISLPALAVAAVVALLVAGIIDLWNTSEEFRDIVTQAWDLISTAFKTGWSMIWNNGLKPLGEALVNLGKALYEFYETSGLKTLFEKVMTGIVGVSGVLFSFLITAVSAAFTAILQAITGLINGISWVVEKITWLKENWSTVLQSIKDFASNIFDSVKDVFNKFVLFVTGKFLSGINSALNGVKNTFRVIFNGIIQIVENAVNFIIRGVNKALVGLDGIADSVGRVIGLDINIPTIREVNLPRLASGTVVPPKAGEFAAILGDNKRETEVVSPLSTMKQALVEALKESGALSGGNVEGHVYIDGKELFRSIVEYAKQEERRTGKNPLMV